MSGSADDDLVDAFNDMLEAMQEAIGARLKEHSPLSEGCKTTLQGPPPCDFGREWLRWRLCRAWSLIEGNKAPTFKDAVREATSEMRERCQLPRLSPEAQFARVQELKSKQQREGLSLAEDRELSELRRYVYF